VNTGYNFITLGAGDRAAEMGRSGVTVGEVAHVVGGVAFGTISTSLAAIDVGTIIGGLAIDIGAMIGRGSVVHNVEVKSYGETIYKGERDLGPTIKNIQSGSLQSRGIFQNNKGFLPQKSEGYYREYEVKDTPNWTNKGAGPERIITGQSGEMRYTPDHYESFTKIK
jgi:hypothetical protein